MLKSEPKKKWVLTSEAFGRLLEWLDDGKDSAGTRYEEMRRRLVAYFDRKNCLAPDDLADETLNRVARRLDEEGSIQTEAPAKYCYIMARFVFLETLRFQGNAGLPLDDVERTEPARFSTSEDKERAETKEQMLTCLEKCTGELAAADRELILGYYVGTERLKIDNRRSLAERFSLTANALSIRACRIRARLQTCVEKCVKNV